jgi:hypothetical protein
MLETAFDDVHLILTDRDCVASKEFAREIYLKYRIRWGWLKNRSKAFLVRDALQ